MAKYSQLQGILSARNEIDDQYNSKRMFQFSPLQGVQDGVNDTFQIPQLRIVVYQDSVMNLFPQVFKNLKPLAWQTDYKMLDLLSGDLQYLTDKPLEEDDIRVSFNWVWFTDIEWDGHLNRGANEIGFASYYVGDSTIAGSEQLADGASAPSDIPDGLFNAIVKMGAALAAKGLATRFSTRYDTSAGDQSFSPSQMAKSFTELAKSLKEEAMTARDDFYKGQGRQFKPIAMPVGYILPNWTPAR